MKNQSFIISMPATMLFTIAVNPLVDLPADKIYVGNKPFEVAGRTQLEELIPNINTFYERTILQLGDGKCTVFATEEEPVHLPRILQEAFEKAPTRVLKEETFLSRWQYITPGTYKTQFGKNLTTELVVSPDILTASCSVTYRDDDVPAPTLTRLPDTNTDTTTPPEDVFCVILTNVSKI